MATLKGVNRTKADSPSSDNILSPGTLGGRVRVLTDSITLAAAQIADTVQIGRDLPAGAIVLGYKLQWAALGAATTLDFGDEDTAARYLAAEATNAAGEARTVLIGGLQYKIGTIADDNTLILTIGGGVATGLVYIEVYYTED